MSLVHLRIKPRKTCQHLHIGNHTKALIIPTKKTPVLDWQNIYTCLMTNVKILDFILITSSDWTMMFLDSHLTVLHLLVSLICRVLHSCCPFFLIRKPCNWKSNVYKGLPIKGTKTFGTFLNNTYMQTSSLLLSFLYMISITFCAYVVYFMTSLFEVAVTPWSLYARLFTNVWNMWRYVCTYVVCEWEGLIPKQG